jgi:predicted RNA-binding protein Jag
MGNRLVVHLIVVVVNQVSLWRQQSQRVIGVRHGSNLVALEVLTSSEANNHANQIIVLAHNAFA